MRRLASILLSISTLGILLTSCGGKASHVQGDLVVHKAYVDCPVPVTPKYEPFIVGEYFLGPTNSQILLDNMDKKDDELKGLRASVKCFKLQAK